MTLPSALKIPSLVIVPAQIGAGKTLVAGAVADWFVRRGSRVSVCVPVQTGAQHRREGLVSVEAEFLAVCANSRHPLDLICPQRYAEAYIPVIAARRANRPLDLDAIDRSLRLMSRDADVMIVQSPGPIMMPMDEKHTTLDLLTALGATAIVVTRPGLEMISPLVLTSRALRDAGVPVAGVVVNRYPADNSSVDQELSLRELEKWCKLPLLCVLPEDRFNGPQLPPGIAAAIDLVDWRSKVSS